MATARRSPTGQRKDLNASSKNKLAHCVRLQVQGLTDVFKCEPVTSWRRPEQPSPRVASIPPHARAFASSRKVLKRNFQDASKKRLGGSELVAFAPCDVFEVAQAASMPITKRTNPPPSETCAAV